MAKKPRILIVDDDPDMRKTLAMILEEIGEITTVGNGHEALAAVSKECPSFVLLDLSMPGMDGLAVLKALRSRKCQALVVMLTSDVEIDTAKRALKLGAHQYITKPFDSDDLRREVRRLLEIATGSDKPESDRPWRTVR